MKTVNLGQIVSILSNIGVIAGIILLAFELNQNQVMMRAQTRDSIANSGSSLQLTIASNADLAESLQRVQAGEDVTDLDRVRWQGVWTAIFRNWENQYYQYSIGLYDEQEYLGIREVFRAGMENNETARSYFCTSRSVRSARFVAEMNELMGDKRCD